MPAALAALPARGAPRAARPTAPRGATAAGDDEGSDTAEGAIGKTPPGPDPALLAWRTVARDGADGGLRAAGRAVGAAPPVDPAADTLQREALLVEAAPAQARPAAAQRGEAHDRAPAIAGSAGRGGAGQGGTGPFGVGQDGAGLGVASEGRAAVPVVGARPVPRVGWSQGRGLAATLVVVVAAVSGLATVWLVGWWLQATGAAREAAPESAPAHSAPAPDGIAAMKPRQISNEAASNHR